MKAHLLSGICVVTLLSAGGEASGAISSFSIGSDMAGGTVTVSWYSRQGGDFIGLSSGEILDHGGGEAFAAVADPFGGNGNAEFTMVGDTFLENWSLKNTANAIIGEVLIDLTGSSAVFDNNADLSTAGSSSGFAGVEFASTLSSAPEHVIAEELSLWAAGVNSGDLFTQQRIVWNTSVGVDTFDAGEEFVWRDDTDLIPSPAGLAVLVLGGLVGTRRRHA